MTKSKSEPSLRAHRAAQVSTIRLHGALPRPVSMARGTHLEAHVRARLDRVTGTALTFVRGVA